MKALSATCGFTPSFPDIGGRRGPCEGSLFPFPAVSPTPSSRPTHPRGNSTLAQRLRRKIQAPPVLRGEEPTSSP